MKRLFKLLLALIVTAPLLALALVWLCFQNTPLTTSQAGISVRDIEQAKRIIRSHDPRDTPAGALRTIMLSQHEVDLILNYAANRFRLAASHVELKQGTAQIQLSLETLGNPFGKWLNIDAMLLVTGNLPEFDHLTIGRVPVPAFIANFALARVISYLNDGGDGVNVPDVVKSVKLLEDRLQVVYAWRDDLPDRLRTVLLPEIDQERMKAYSDHLAEVINQISQSTDRISLPQLLQPMFAFAQQRSASGDPAKENRAALITLAFYANGRGLTALIPAARNWRQPEPMWVTLEDRYDTPKHYIISAAIAAEAGSPLADVIGLYKEVNDARGGSGFSFNDLAADRAGTRLGERAVRTPQELQARLAAGVQESDMMPAVSDLPEDMQEAEFIKRYGGVDAPRYNKMLNEIDARIAATSIFKE